MAERVVFLDRDGTINVDHAYVHKKEDWEWTPGAIAALASLQDAGYVLAIITNQSGIARGYYTEADMHALHDFMNAELAQHGVTVDVIAYCPHGRGSTCVCRKPKTGMAADIEEKIGEIDYAHSWTIGDKEADVLFGKALGTKTALVRSEYWEQESLSQQPDIIVDSLSDAAVAMTVSAS